NPFLSIEPILAVPGLREAIARSAAPVAAVSPIIAGRAVKGPTAKMMSELGLKVSAMAVARRYQDLLDAYGVGRADAPGGAELGIAARRAPPLRAPLADREDVARHVLARADALAKATV